MNMALSHNDKYTISITVIENSIQMSYSPLSNLEQQGKWLFCTESTGVSFFFFLSRLNSEVIYCKILGLDEYAGLNGLNDAWLKSILY